MKFYMKSYYILLIPLFALILSSCYEPKMEKIYYDYPGMENVVRAKLFYPYGKNDSTCDVKTYYTDGQLNTKGRLLGSKRVGDWQFWYKDSTMEIITYKDGKIDFEKTDQITPYLVLASDSLKIGVPSKFKIIGTHTFFNIGVSENAEMILEGEEQTVIPLSGDSVTFYYFSFEEENYDEACKKTLSTYMSFPEEKLENISLYKVHEVVLKSVPVFK